MPVYSIDSEEYDEYWYRFEDEPNGSWSDGKNTYYGIRQEKYGVIRHTPCGVILDIGHRHRFTPNEGVKVFARASETDAMLDYRYRKLKQRKILRHRLDFAERAVTTSEKLVDNGVKVPCSNY